MIQAEQVRAIFYFRQQQSFNFSFHILEQGQYLEQRDSFRLCLCSISVVIFIARSHPSLPLDLWQDLVLCFYQFYCNKLL